MNEIEKIILERFRYFPDTGILESNLSGEWRPAGFRRHKGRARLAVRIEGKMIFVHRICYFLYYGEWPNLTDHINCIQDDNRIENLRNSDVSTNQANRGKNKNNTSGFKGVSQTSNGRWRANIRCMNVLYYLGIYGTKEEAALAYDKAAIEKFGEYAKTNF